MGPAIAAANEAGAGTDTALIGIVMARGACTETSETMTEAEPVAGEGREVGPLGVHRRLETVIGSRQQMSYACHTVTECAHRAMRDSITAMTLKMKCQMRRMNVNLSLLAGKYLMSCTSVIRKMSANVW